MVCPAVCPDLHQPPTHHGGFRSEQGSRIPPQIFGSKLRHPQTKVANPVQVLGGLNLLNKGKLVVVIPNHPLSRL